MLKHIIEERKDIGNNKGSPVVLTMTLLAFTNAISTVLIRLLI